MILLETNQYGNGRWTSLSLPLRPTEHFFFLGQQAIPGAKVLDKTCAPGKCKFFMWLALHGRCWTAARRKKQNQQDDDTCILCGQEPEEIDHLLVRCSFSREIWHTLLRRVDVAYIVGSMVDSSKKEGTQRRYIARCAGFLVDMARLTDKIKRSLI